MCCARTLGIEFWFSTHTHIHNWPNKMETRRIQDLTLKGAPVKIYGQGMPRVFLVAPDNPYEKRGQSGNASSTQHEELPDGQLLHLSYERFKCPEAGAGWEKEAAEAIRSWGSAFLQGSFPAHFHWAAGDRGRNCWKLHLLLRWWLMNNTYVRWGKCQVSFLTLWIWWKGTKG